MVHCPDGEMPFEETGDVEFGELDATTGFLPAPKRCYLVACSECGTAIGSGVAGAEA